jgi:hypothetical protein
LKDSPDFEHEYGLSHIFLCAYMIHRNQQVYSYDEEARDLLKSQIEKYENISEKFERIEPFIG